MAEPLKHLAWDDFRLVKAVAEARGMPGAAAELGINHSTVFRRLGQIEEALGPSLFERHRTGYALTAAGEEMVSLAQRVDGDITAFTRKIAGQVVAPEGELRVTTNDSLLVHLLTPMFASFRDKWRGRAARYRARQPGAEPVEARRRRRHPRNGRPAGEPRRAPRGEDRMGALRARLRIRAR